MERDLFTVEQLREYLSCSRGFVYRLMKDHKLPHVQLGRRIYFRKKDVDKFMESKLMK
jgi:excisionase family DNA binding protein